MDLPTAVTIRPARPEDSLRCQAIALAAWEPIHAARRRLLGDSLHEHLHAGWREAKAAQIASAFEHHLDWIAVADASPAEAVVGFVTFRIDRHRSLGTIGNNAVDPAWQGRGIATALYRHALDRFRAAGMRAASVTTGLDAGHAPALAAYRKVGFTAEVPSVTLYIDFHEVARR